MGDHSTSSEITQDSCAARAWLGLAAAALVFGALARMLFPTLTAFGLDEGIASILTRQLVGQGQIPLVGVKTSLHFYNPPLLPWLFAPWFALSRDPAVATEFVALLGVAAAGGMGWCGWRLSNGNRAVAATAVLLAALSPTWIEHSRRLWGHALILPSTVAALIFAARWILDGRRWALTGLIASIAAAQALHFSGALLWISFGLIWILTPRARRPRIGVGPLLAGVAVALLWYGPYCVHLLETGFVDVRIIADAILGRARAASDPVGSPLSAFLFTLADLGHNDVMGIVPSTWPAFYRSILPPMRALSALLLLAAAGAAILDICRKWQSSGSEETTPPNRALPEASPLAMWGLVLTGVPTVAFSLVRASFVPAYLLPAAPGIALLVARTAGEAMDARRSHRAARLAFGGAMLAWAAVSALNWIAATRALATATPESQTFTTLRDQRRAVDWIVRESGGEPALVTQGERNVATGIDYSYLYLLWAASDDATRFRSLDDWRRLFLIRDSKERLLPTVDAALEAVLDSPGAERVVFGNLTVYEADRGEGERLIGDIEGAVGGVSAP